MRIHSLPRAHRWPWNSREIALVAENVLSYSHEPSIVETVSTHHVRHTCARRRICPTFVTGCCYAPPALPLRVRAEIRSTSFSLRRPHASVSPVSRHRRVSDMVTLPVPRARTRTWATRFPRCACDLHARAGQPVSPYDVGSCQSFVPEIAMKPSEPSRSSMMQGSVSVAARSSRSREWRVHAVSGVAPRPHMVVPSVSLPLVARTATRMASR
jgi:hypothetical protein